MNTKIQDLTNQLEAIQGDVLEIENELQLAWNEVFKDLGVINDAIKEVEASNNYVWDSHGEIVSWISFDVKAFLNCKSYFENFMQENHFVNVEWNGALTYAVGPSIVINEDGDVYDQDGGKFFVKRTDYETETERNSLIETYMEKQGYFPGVFESDRYGNISLVNTKE